MASPDDVLRLAALSRIRVTDAELPKLATEFESILAYISQLDELSIDMSAPRAGAVRNVMREDGDPHESGKFTEALAAQFPAREGNALKVKQIITHD